MAEIIFPEATLYVSQPVGQLLSTDFKSGVTIDIKGDKAHFTVLAGGKKAGEVAFDAAQAEKMAEFWRKAADILNRQGGSGLPVPKTVKAQRINEGE